MTRSTYTVNGMACGHCAGFITEEIERVPGVTAVAVDVDNGTVAVTSDGDLHVADVRTAVEEAGYELVAADQQSRTSSRGPAVESAERRSGRPKLPTQKPGP
ncbi:heavy-metal-associated domain-containing protein [Streptomyces sp. NPDC048441]|uniref:heavy-metal-associated domain-containing protein n=1 Tax=Streptomyces sp. NPDC048441 TaxID=3365552 RepID=UPI00372162A2